MEYTGEFVDSTLGHADSSGKEEREFKNIIDQFSEMVHQGNYSMRKMYKKPLTDLALRPFGESTKVTVKERINKDVYNNIMTYEYTFIYKPGDEDND